MNEYQKYQRALELPIKMLATLREMEHRLNKRTYEECDAIAAGVMKRMFEEYTDRPDDKLYDDAGTIEDMVKGSQLIQVMRDAL